MKEFTTLSPMREIASCASAVFVDSKQLAALTAVLDDVCRQAGLEPGSPECDDAASFIMRLYWDGHRTAEDLKAAMLDSAEVTIRKALDQSESPAPADCNASSA